MKKFYLSVLFVAIGLSLFAQSKNKESEGYNIKVKINGLSNTPLYLAHHFGDKQYMSDTIQLDANGEGAFKGPEPLPGGLYLVVLPSRTYFEIVINDDQDFSIENDTTNFIENFKSKGSLENEIFYDDIRFVGKRQTERMALQAKVDADPNNQKLIDSVKARLAVLDQEVKDNRKKIIETYPQTLYAQILNLLSDIEVPEAPRDSNGALIDSFFEYRYKKAHYFDNVNFADDRLLRTPILLQKVNIYLDNWVSPDPDSIIVVVDRILDEAQKNDDAFWFWTVTLLNRYANSKIMGQDAVYVHIVMKEYKTGHAFWASKADSARIVSRAETRSHLLIGKKAPNLHLKDTTGTYRELYDIDADYIVLFFYSDECGHCKKETPKLVAAYDSLRTKYNIKIVAVDTENDRQNWLDFIHKNHMEGWINLADVELQNFFRQVYNIESTPTFFLLDKDKIIRGNRFNSSQLDYLLGGVEKTLHEEDNNPTYSDHVIIDNK